MERLNEAIGNFFKAIEDLGQIEIDNAVSELPTSEIEEYEETIKSVITSSEVKKMKNLWERWKSIGK